MRVGRVAYQCPRQQCRTTSARDFHIKIAAIAHNLTMLQVSVGGNRIRPDSVSMSRPVFDTRTVSAASNVELHHECE
ncbi:hypothetical protein F2P81_001134 [Scophthalmus maximus]|uniref:Uncharacterized protein n=1 Tax=Scophthalmus maximus TaxID=52904 RepID=A0A6A4TYD2_SCOMX|nr:hypothetical protein F2P81_001134 [Scophthalmus maximus]